MAGELRTIVVGVLGSSAVLFAVVGIMAFVMAVRRAARVQRRLVDEVSRLRRDVDSLVGASKVTASTPDGSQAGIDGSPDARRDRSTAAHRALRTDSGHHNSPS